MFSQLRPNGFSTQEWFWLNKILTLVSLLHFCVFLRIAFAWAVEHGNWKHLPTIEQEKSLCLHPPSCKLYTSVIEVKHCPTVTIWQSFLTALTGIYPCGILKWIRFSELHTVFTVSQLDVFQSRASSPQINVVSFYLWLSLTPGQRTIDACPKCDSQLINNLTCY